MSASTGCGHAVAYALGGFVPRGDLSRRSSVKPKLLDDLVGGHQQLVRHGEAEHPGGLVIDDQFDFV
jgi:hypothetical protein